MHDGFPYATLTYFLDAEGEPAHVRAMPERLRPPWSVRDNGSAFIVETADKIPVSWTYYRDDQPVGTGPVYLTRDQARRVAANIAKLPVMLTRRGGSTPANGAKKNPETG